MPGEGVFGIYGGPPGKKELLGELKQEGNPTRVKAPGGRVNSDQDTVAGKGPRGGVELPSKGKELVG